MSHVTNEKASGRRPNRSAAGRRAQYDRAHAKSIQLMLRTMKSMEHRGCKKSRMGNALCRALSEGAEHPCAYPHRRMDAEHFEVMEKLRSQDERVCKMASTITGMYETQFHMLQMLHNYSREAPSVAPVAPMAAPSGEDAYDETEWHHDGYDGSTSVDNESIVDSVAVQVPLVPVEPHLLSFADKRGLFSQSHNAEPTPPPSPRAYNNVEADASDDEDTDSVSGGVARQDPHYGKLVKCVDGDTGSIEYGFVLKVLIGRRSGIRYYLVQFAEYCQQWQLHKLLHPDHHTSAGDSDYLPNDIRGLMKRHFGNELRPM